MDVQACLGVLCKLAILIMLEIDIGKTEGVGDVYKKECAGTSNGLSTSGDSVTRYERYRQMYENCTRVTKNIEIIHLQLTDARYDFAFLENIREVSGYVLIFGNLVKSMRLKNLRVIRGFTQYHQVDGDGKNRSFSLYVAFNSHRDNDMVGLEQLQLPSLVEITRGNVMFQANRRLCFGENTINWKLIISDANAQFWSPVVSNYTKIDCTSLGTCSESCKEFEGQRNCWGHSGDMCQKIIGCSNQCPKLCTENGICCAAQCTAGCTGPSNKECLSCRKYVRYLQNENLFECVDKCVGDQIKDKFVLGTRCVDGCPQNMVSQTLNDEIFCVASCSNGYTRHEDTGECIACADKCPKVCDGTEFWFNKGDVERFRGCVQVVGNLIIDNATFNGHPRYPKIDAFEDLNAMSDVREVTGAVVIKGWHEKMTFLWFLQNLKTIYGNEYGNIDRRFTLLVYGSSLESLGLKSLESIKGGTARFRDNPSLCYMNGLNLSTILLDKTDEMKIQRNKDPVQCEREGKVCSHRCTNSGCWGPGDDECINCKEFIFEGQCVKDCASLGFDNYCVKEGRRGNAECHRDCGDNAAAATKRYARILHVVMTVMTVIIIL